MLHSFIRIIGKYGIISALLTGIVLYSCIEPFTPPETNSDENYPVVDGFLNTGNDTSRIELRRTQNVNQMQDPIIETGATITAEQEEGAEYVFKEISEGIYILPPQSFNMSGKYRLRIRTAAGQEYLSEYVAVTITPQIDSLTYKLDDSKTLATFYVNTHDAQNRTEFYRWKFDETWEYHSAYVSNLEVINKELYARKFSIEKCWSRRNSASILLGNTVKLSSNIIKDQPLHVVPIITNKLYIKYSIRVKQYGLSREAFEYWTSLAKTTQGTGSLFDPLPSQVTGNFRNTGDPHDLVFGYFTATNEVVRRLTITPKLGAYKRCIDPDTLPIRCVPGEDCATITSNLILNYWGPRSDSVLAAPASCADCRLEGGTLDRPSYW